MRCVAVCQTAVVARNLHRALATSVDLHVMLRERVVARRLHESDLSVHVADPQRVDSYLKLEVDPSTCVIVEDDGRHSLRRVLPAILDAGATLVYVLLMEDNPRRTRTADWQHEFPEVQLIRLSDLLRQSLLTELGRSLTRARVQQYQRYFHDADRVLILLHNDPDPDAMASGLALRSLLKRTKTTAVLGAFQGVTRPENLRMARLLDIAVEPVTAETLSHFDRFATVDVQPHYFGGILNRVDLVVDHHPEQTGYSAVFRDIRADYGSTSTILTEHFRAVDATISERLATAMLYAIKSDTLFLSRQTNRSDLEAFTFLYPLADAALIREMEGAGITLERLQYVTRAVHVGAQRNQIYTTHLSEAPREDLVPYVADYLLQLEGVSWSVVSGIVRQDVVISVRNLGYSRRAGEFVQRCFSDLGSAGGHRAMAKAVVPVAAFRRKYGSLDAEHVTRVLGDLVEDFLAEGPISGSAPLPRAKRARRRPNRPVSQRGTGIRTDRPRK